MGPVPISTRDEEAAEPERESSAGRCVTGALIFLPNRGCCELPLSALVQNANFSLNKKCKRRGGQEGTLTTPHTQRLVEQGRLPAMKARDGLVTPTFEPRGLKIWMWFHQGTTVSEMFANVKDELLLESCICESVLMGEESNTKGLVKAKTCQTRALTSIEAALICNTTLF